MRRTGSIVIPLISAALLVGCAADVKTTLDSGQRLVEPVVEALSAYHQKHGEFPTNLTTLVSDGLLKSVPTLPEKFGTSGVWPLAYQVSPDRSFYYLHFSYDFPDFLAPDELVTRYKISYEPDWGTRSYPPGFQELVAHRVGARFRDKGAADALDIAVAALISTAKRGRSTVCINLSRAFVSDCLGPGVQTSLPDTVSPAKGPTELYASTDGTRRYCFAYMHKDDDKRPQHGYFLKDSHVADIIYRVQTEAGQDRWSVVEKCR